MHAYSLFFSPDKTTLLGQGYAFCGGGGNIAIVTALPLFNFVRTALCLWYLYNLFFYAWLELRFPDVETSCCDQLVIGPTHACGRTLDLLMTDVPDLVQVAVGAPLGSSDQSSLSIAISLAQAIPNLYFSRRVLLKHRVNCTPIWDAISVLPWRSIWSADNSVERFNVHLSLLVERFVLTKVIRVRTKDKPWFNDDCSRAFDLKQEAHLRWTRDRSRVNWYELVHY